MPIVSKDQKPKNAIKDINAMDSVQQVRDYVLGDDRQDIINAAAVQIEFIEKSAPVSAAPPVQPIDPKDTTPEWIGKFENLQPKQGEVESITRNPENAGIKDVVQKEHRNKILTIRSGVPHWVYYDEKGDELRSEAVPGHGTPIVMKEEQHS